MGVVTVLITGVVLFFKAKNDAAPTVYFPDGHMPFASSVNSSISSPGHTAYIKVREGDIDQAKTVLKPWVRLTVGSDIFDVFELKLGIKDFVVGVTKPGSERVAYFGGADATGIRDGFGAAVTSEYIKTNAAPTVGARVASVAMPDFGTYYSRWAVGGKWTLNKATESTHLWDKELAQVIVADMPSTDNKFVLYDKTGPVLLTLQRQDKKELADIEIGYAPIEEVVGACDHTGGRTPVGGCEGFTADYHPEILSTILTNWGGGGYAWWSVVGAHLGGANCPPVVFVEQ